MKKRFIIEGILLVLILTFVQGCAPQATPSAVNTAVPEPATQVNTANTAIPATDSIQAASDTPQVTTANTAIPTTESIQAASDTPQAVQIDGAALVEERCTVCHSTARIHSKSASADGWAQTVTRMISNGAVLSADEKAALIEYLAATYP